VSTATAPAHGSAAVPLRARPYARRVMPRAATDSGATRASDSQALLAGLRRDGPAREAAVSELHALLLRGARHELGRRREALAHVSRDEREDLATQAADDALAAILAKLDAFRGASRFTTWAYKFVLLEAGVKARRRAWQGREVALEDASWRRLADRAPSAQQSVEHADLLRAVAHAMETALTPHQREVFAALALDGVPIDVLAERLASSRGALYKTLHDARRKLRAALSDAGYALHDHTGGGT
jgi:RNA polymerase sigma-70 factor, ECF subfamily